MVACCANCEVRLLPGIENERFVLEEGDAGEIPGVVTASQAVSVVFNCKRIKQNCCDSNTIGLCPSCISVLTELYKFFTRFRNQTTGSSYIQRFLSDPNWNSHDVNCINNPNQDPDLTGFIKQEQEMEEEQGNRCDEWILSNIIPDMEKCDVDLPMRRDSPTSANAQVEISARLRLRKARITQTRLPRVKKGKTRPSRSYAKKVYSLPARQSMRLIAEKVLSEAVAGPTLQATSTVEKQKNLKEQDQNAESTKPFACNKCDPPKRYALFQHLNLHERSCHPTNDGSQPKFECRHCSLEFQGERGLRSHMKVEHQEVLKFDCVSCAKSFSRLSSLSEHQKTFHIGYSTVDKEKNSCPVCWKVSPSYSRLKIHLTKIHTACEALQCSECHKIFFAQQSFEFHMNVIHSEEYQANTHACDLCDRSFYGKQGLQNHVNVVHLNKKEFVCDVCGHKTTCQANLRRHQEIHDLNRERKYSCPTCYKEYSSRRSMSKHSVTHFSTYLCPHCGKVLTNPGSLRRHIQAIHRDIPEVSAKTKTHPCPICGKVFKLREYLRQHLRSKSHGGTGRHQNQIAERKQKNEAKVRIPEADTNNYRGQSSASFLC